MNKIRPVDTSYHTLKKPFIHPKLNESSHVFIRNDGVKPSLTPPYSGPFLVIKRGDKVFQLNINGNIRNISIDRLKPAFLPIVND